jgi:trans-aconitate methyltransferase
MNLRETYNRIAGDWHKDHKISDWWVEGTNKFVSFLPKSANVLDVGCGPGDKSKFLSQKGLRIIGIDFSENLIDISRKNAPDAHFIVMDMKDVGQITHLFDGIFAQASLLHIPKNEIQEVLGTLISKLTPGGYLYVAVKGMRDNGVEEETLEENDYGYPYKRFFSYFSMDELVKYFSDLHLEIVYKDSKLVGRTNWLQIVGKKK